MKAYRRLFPFGGGKKEILLSAWCPATTWRWELEKPPFLQTVLLSGPKYLSPVIRAICRVPKITSWFDWIRGGEAPARSKHYPLVGKHSEYPTTATGSHKNVNKKREREKMIKSLNADVIFPSRPSASRHISFLWSPSGGTSWPPRYHRGACNSSILARKRIETSEHSDNLPEAMPAEVLPAFHSSAEDITSPLIPAFSAGEGWSQPWMKLLSAARNIQLPCSSGTPEVTMQQPWWGARPMGTAFWCTQLSKPLALTLLVLLKVQSICSLVRQKVRGTFTRLYFLWYTFLMCGRTALFLCTKPFSKFFQIKCLLSLRSSLLCTMNIKKLYRFLFNRPLIF